MIEENQLQKSETLSYASSARAGEAENYNPGLAVGRLTLVPEGDDPFPRFDNASVQADGIITLTVRRDPQQPDTERLVEMLVNARESEAPTIERLRPATVEGVEKTVLEDKESLQPFSLCKKVASERHQKKR